MKEYKTTEEQRQYYRNYYRTNWLGRLRRHLHAAKLNHGDRVTITIEQLVEQLKNQNYLCYYTGIPLNMDAGSSKGAKKMSVSIDRLDNTKSYEPGNVVICLWHVNRAKHSLSEHEFLEMCNAVSNWKRKKELES